MHFDPRNLLASEQPFHRSICIQKMIPRYLRETGDSFKASADASPATEEAFCFRVLSKATEEALKKPGMLSTDRDVP